MTATAFTIITGTIRTKEPLQYHGDKPFIRMAIPENIRRGDKERTIWHNFTFWNKQAIFADANYHKGSIVSVTCSITKKDGYINFNVTQSTPIANFGPAEKIRQPKQDAAPAPEQPATEPPANPEDSEPKKLTARPKSTRKRNTRRKPAA